MKNYSFKYPGLRVLEVMFFTISAYKKISLWCRRIGSKALLYIFPRRQLASENYLGFNFSIKDSVNTPLAIAV